MFSINVRFKRVVDAVLGILSTTMLAVGVIMAGFLLVWIATLLT